MGLYSYKDENHQHMYFIHGDLGKPCVQCGDLADILCDYPVGDDLTCDRALCENDSYEIGVDTHYCKMHNRLWEQFVQSGGIEDNLRNLIPFKA